MRNTIILITLFFFAGLATGYHSDIARRAFEVMSEYQHLRCPCNEYRRTAYENLLRYPPVGQSGDELWQRLGRPTYIVNHRGSGRIDETWIYEDLYEGAADGSPHAMNDLGIMYRFGQGVKVDESKAVRLFSQAVKNGCPDALLNLANCYRHGSGVNQDLDKARSLYAEAAKLGDKTASERLKQLTFPVPRPVRQKI